jgi:hypothetical protein
LASCASIRDSAQKACSQRSPFKGSSPGTSQVDIRPALADVVDRARRLPGNPFRINLQIDGLQAPGQLLDYNMTVSLKVVTGGCHRTLAIPLRGGRYRH